MQLRVAVLYGGRSGEHEISVRSAESIMKAMDPDKYKVLPYFINQDGRWDPRPILPEPGVDQGFDVVFPVLDGTFGEDGTMQGLLELADVPYVDSAGISELVRAFVSLSRKGGRLKLLSLTRRVHELLEITKLLSVFESFDSEEEAVASFSGSTAA